MASVCAHFVRGSKDRYPGTGLPNLTGPTLYTYIHRGASATTVRDVNKCRYAYRLVQQSDIVTRVFPSFLAIVRAILQPLTFLEIRMLVSINSCFSSLIFVYQSLCAPGNPERFNFSAIQKKRPSNSCRQLDEIRGYNSLLQLLGPRSAAGGQSLSISLTSPLFVAYSFDSRLRTRPRETDRKGSVIEYIVFLSATFRISWLFTVQSREVLQIRLRSTYIKLVSNINCTFF